MKMKTYIKNLRQSSLHLNVIYEYLNVHVSIKIIKRDILDKRIYAEKSFFKFLALKVNNHFIHDYMIYVR